VTSFETSKTQFRSSQKVSLFGGERLASDELCDVGGRHIIIGILLSPVVERRASELASSITVSAKGSFDESIVGLLLWTHTLLIVSVVSS
jgi:hypothetical protein